MKNKDKGYNISLIMSIALIAGLLVMWGYSIWVTRFGAPKSAAEFGDMFGAVNTIFSGLALAGVVLSILMQKNELEQQREELSLQREELRSSVEQLEGQKNIMSQQALEVPFFRLLDLAVEKGNVNVETRSEKSPRRASLDIARQFHQNFLTRLYRSKASGKELRDLYDSLYVENFFDHNSHRIRPILTVTFKMFELIYSQRQTIDVNWYVSLACTYLNEEIAYIIYGYALSDLIKPTEKHLIRELSVIKELRLIIDDKSVLELTEYLADEFYTEKL